MNRPIVALSALGLCACVPDLSVKASRVDASRVVAVRSTPAEADPGQSVTWEAIVVRPRGIESAFQIDWAMCSAPRSPSDSITVAQVCLTPIDPTMTDATVTQVPEASGALVQGSVPSDACRKIGPEVPQTDEMGNKQRAPDPDITGGYQLPLRLLLSDSSGIDISFDRQRVRCALANAPSADARNYQVNYKANQNPALNSLRVANGPQTLVGAVGGFGGVQAGQTIPIQVIWDPAVQESYLYYDPQARALTERSENLEIAWFTNGGHFERDRTTPDSFQPASDNQLIVDGDVSGEFTVWILLRDDRGGVGVTTLTFVAS